MYRETAEIYDKLTSGIDYKSYAGYFAKLINKYKTIETHSVLETGCGSGSLTRILGAAGFDMTGVDICAEMLSEAYSKGDPGILWINQDVLDLDLFGTYDAVLSFLDFPNHITEPGNLLKYFSLVNNYLNPNGLFIFDINTIYKFKKVLSDNVFYYDEEDYSCIWQNHFNEESKICSMDITVYRRDGELFKRSDSKNSERAYSIKEIKQTAKTSGLSVVDVLGDRSMEQPRDKEERVFFVIKKGQA